MPKTILKKKFHRQPVMKILLRPNGRKALTSSQDDGTSMMGQRLSYRGILVAINNFAVMSVCIMLFGS